MTTKPHRSPEYAHFLRELKHRITVARNQARKSINGGLVLSYWNIGKAIVEKQKARGWGQEFIEFLERDLQKAFPGLHWFSKGNLRAICRFYIDYEGSAVVKQLAGASSDNE